MEEGRSPGPKGSSSIDGRRSRSPGRTRSARSAIDARVRDQVAEVQVSQTFHNPGSVQLESEYLFPLPEDGAIQNFVLLVDGRELPGRLMPKDEARRIYEEIVRTKRDPALLEYMGRGLYRTSVFPIPPGADRKVTMRYTQLCKRDRDVVEFSYPLSTQKFTAKPIQRLALNLSIQSKDAIKSIYCPSDDARIDRSGDHEARVSLERRDVSPGNDFRLVYTLAEGRLGASVLSYRPSSRRGRLLPAPGQPRGQGARRQAPAQDGHLRARPLGLDGRQEDRAGPQGPEIRAQQPPRRRPVQHRRLRRPGRELQARAPALLVADPRGGRAVRRQHPRGGLDQHRLGPEDGPGDDPRRLPAQLRPVPDRRPADGRRDPGAAIAENCRQANSRRARLFSFGVGFDVNARLLDRLSGGNSGTSEYVKPDEDIETHVGRFYAKMTSPVLSDIRVELAGTDVNRTYPRDLPDLFEGGQIVWVGRYRQSGRTTLRLTGKVGGERRSFEFPAELADSDRGSTYDFVERLWAMRRVGYLIDQIDLHGQNKELIDELVSLSTRYGILTPYTSFLADERVPLHAAMQNAARAGQNRWWR